MPERSRPVLEVEEARDRILSTVSILEEEMVPTLDAVFRVLTEPITADRDVPPATNAAMDGYAIRAEDATDVPVRLTLIGDVAAGHMPDRTVGPGEAMRIMTGAPVPSGADTVVRFERTREHEGQVEILKSPSHGKNVRQAGEDVREGETVLQAGTVLRPQEIGMLSALGKLNVQVYRRPRVAILATGDEVVPPHQTPGPGQIRDANSYTVAAQVQAYGGIPMMLGVAHDREELVRQGVRDALEREADLIVTTGGVSVGDFDLVKQILAAEGEMHFWSLNMKPGRPMAFGVVNGVPLLGLPGNPVATMISMELFGRPAMLKMQGFTDWWRPVVRARLQTPIERKDNRRHYLRVQLHETPAGLEASLTGDQGSGILNSLLLADGLAVIPEDANRLPAGSEVDVLLLPRTL